MLKGFFRDKLYVGINVVGLAIAMTICSVLGLYLRTELGYDEHNLLKDRIYRIANSFIASGVEQRIATTSTMLAPTLAENFPEVEQYVRFRSPGYWETGFNRLIRHGNDAFYWDQLYFADANVFEVFTHDVLRGDPGTALRDPASVAISETFAHKYFGDADPLGEVISLDNGQQWTIRLVFADLPANSHLRYDLLFSYAGLPKIVDAQEQRAEYFGASDFTYVVMPAHYDVNAFAAISQEVYDRFMAERGREIHVEGWKAWLQPLTSIHLGAVLANDQPVGNLAYLLGLEAVTVFILLIACINYINLATARAARRAREIGIRKILGSSRGMLVLRFVGEAVALSSLALLVSLLLLELALPFTHLAEWLGEPSLLDEWRRPDVLAAMAIFSMVIGVLSGLYPAFYLSSLPVVRALAKGRVPAKGLRLRELLVVSQFGITVAVLSCVFVMQRQMQFIADSPLGFDEKGKLMVALRGVDVLTQYPVIERELESRTEIHGVTIADSMLGLELPIGFMDVEANDGNMQGVLVRHLPTTADFIEVAGMQMVAGRSFSPDIETDRTQTMIVNEALVRQMGWDDPIGKRMGVRGRRVIGVVRDFNYESLHLPVAPLIIYQNGSAALDYIPPDQRAFKLQYMLLDVDLHNLDDTLDFIAATIRRFDPVHPLDYRFIDEAMTTRYHDERDLMSLIGVFAGISILIACLGLFGLATFTTSQRTKEIGIRKVLGSSVWSIVLLLTNDFSKLVLLANVIAWPTAWYAMHRWLESFAYRVDLTPLIFIGSGLIALCVAWVTVGGTAAKAANAKPVSSLRYE